MLNFFYKIYFAFFSKEILFTISIRVEGPKLYSITHICFNKSTLESKSNLNKSNKKLGHCLIGGYYKTICFL